MSNKVNEVKEGLLEQIGQKIALTGAGTAVKQGEEIVIVFREDNPTVILEDEPVKLAGVLDSPAVWLEARKSIIEPLAAYALVDRNALQIELVTEERYKFKNRITGTLTFHPAFKLFDINGSNFITAQKLGEKIKMNRTFFESKSDAMALVAKLINFEAKVDKDIAQANDGRGNTKQLRAQIVTSNLPEAFKMKLPIFKGQDAQVFEVEVEIEPSDLTCRLVSPEANEETEHLRDTAIDAVLDRMKAALPGIVILEK